MSSTAELDPTGVACARSPRMASMQLGLAVALHAGDADDLAAVDGEVDVVEERCGRRPSGR